MVQVSPQVFLLRPAARLVLPTTVTDDEQQQLLESPTLLSGVRLLLRRRGGRSRFFRGEAAVDRGGLLRPAIQLDQRQPGCRR